ncbi:MAG: tetratricopeptide repeat protein [Puniceicoccaceae bacterium]|nr:MAG: tetratricopeptide repeat protein [Puniceicoccaceae bacterium]
MRYRSLRLSLLTILLASAGIATAFGQFMQYPSEEYWRDPENIKRFLASYGFKADIEPSISTEEQQIFRTLIEQMATDRNLALRTLEGAIKPDSSAALHFTLGNFYFERGRQQDAISRYRTAIQKHPSFMRAHRNLGILLVQTARWSEAIESLSQAANLGAVDSIVYGLLGLSFLNQGRPTQAETAYRNAILFDAKTRDWKLGLARSLLEQQKYVEGAALLEELIKETPDERDLWLFQANAFLGLDQPLRAATNYEIVRRMGQATPESLMLLGDIYMNDDMRDLALDAYLEAIELAPDQPIERPVRAAETLTIRGAHDQAERMIARIRETYPRLDEATELTLLRLDSRIALARGAGAEAARILEQIVERDPLDGDALILLANHFQRQGEFERAGILYERAARVSRFEAEALTAHAQMLVGRGQFARAVPLLERAQSIRPRDNVARYLDQVRQAAAATRES